MTLVLFEMHNITQYIIQQQTFLQVIIKEKKIQILYFVQF